MDRAFTGARRIDWVSSIPFFVFHALAIAGVAMLGWSWSGLGLAVGLYFVRMFGVTAGYHRYFSHRTFKTSRTMQFFFALLAMSSAQKGIIWWAAHHRAHHKLSDQPGDVHSTKLDGFLWAHVGWIISYRWSATDESRVRDLLRYPELRWLNKNFHVPPLAYGLLTFLVGGWWGLVWGMFVSTVLLWHGTFTINSLTHTFGSRRYVTEDSSRNNPWLALITMGEGWHNNHHYYQRAANQGFFWWEIDLTYYVLRLLQAVGLVWDVHTPPRKVLESNRIATAPVNDTPGPEPVAALAAPLSARAPLPAAPSPTP